MSTELWGGPTLRLAWYCRMRRRHPAGLTLMGVRVYNPMTGRFIQTDPVPGGNANAYVYPQDPINAFDLDGRMRQEGDEGWRVDIIRHSRDGYSPDFYYPRTYGNPFAFLGKAVKACAAVGFGPVGSSCGAVVALKVCATQGKRACTIAVVSTASGAIVDGAASSFAKRALRKATKEGHVGKGVKITMATWSEMHGRVAEFSVRKRMERDR